MSLIAAFVSPDIFNYLGTQGEKSLKLSLQITGIMFQSISALMLAFRFFRGPDVERAIKNHQSMNELISNEFQELLKARTPEAHAKILELTETKREVERFYSSAYVFGETERQVTIAGFMLFALGAHLQLICAG